MCNINDFGLLTQEDIQISKRLLGDTKHFCPVALKIYNVLRSCTDEIAAKYREKTFYFSSLDARDAFLLNPAQFVAQTKPLQVQADRKTGVVLKLLHEQKFSHVLLIPPLFPASCTENLFAGSPRVRQVNCWRMARTESGAVPHKVQRAAPNADHSQDKEKGSLC